MTDKTPNPEAQVCEHTNDENEDRICETCGAGPISAGYVLNGGCYYYCTIECLRADAAKEDSDSDLNEWLKKYDAEALDEEDGGDLEFIYWTEWEDDDYPQAPDADTATIAEAISQAMRTLEAEDMDLLNDVAERYENELAELRAQIRLDNAAFNSIRMALNNAREFMASDAGYSSTAHEFIEQCEFADMLLAGALLKSQKEA